MGANAKGRNEAPIEARDEAKTGRLGKERNEGWRLSAPLPFGLLPKTRIAALQRLAGRPARVRLRALRCAFSALQRVCVHSVNRPWTVSRTGICCAVALACAVLHSPCSVAQSYPERAVKIIAGTVAGGQSDRLARVVAEGLDKIWGEAVVVETRPGADGTIAADAVAHATADGYTLLLAGQSNLALVAAQGRSIRYDPVADFAPIGRIARVPLVLAVSARVPAATLAEVVAIAKANPGTLTYGSTGIQSRLAAELLKSAEGLDIVEVPYKGVPPALADLLAARIDMAFVDASIAVPHADVGTLRLVAAAGARRIAAAPDVPTLEELGFRGVRIEPWYGLVAPAKTPAAVLARLRSGLAELRRTTTYQRQLRQLGYEALDDSPEQFAAEIASDTERFAGILKGTRLASPP